MTNLIWVALGGAIGSSLRYFTSSILKYINPNLPLGTVIVNILGSFLIGLLMSKLENKSISENFIRYFLIVGVLGSYTTFSTFSYEVIDLINNKKFLFSISYILFSVFTCLFAALLGYNINKI